MTSRIGPRTKLFATAGIVALASLTAIAQQPGPMPQIQVTPQQQSSATVSGRVSCADTQRAARFAQVTLIPVEAASENAGRGGPGFGRGGAARTDLDGNFTVTNVQPGDYYATASSTGYISEAALLMAAGTDAATALSHLPTVHVIANSPSTVNISLERGGVVAGRVQWDDGTAAAGVQINLQAVTASTGGGFGGRAGILAGFIGGNNQFSMTDDRGQFRISGIAPGDYLLRSTVQTPVSGGNFTRMSAVVMYAPGKVRRADAQIITVHAGEERTDLAITIDLSTLHRVSGHVAATSGTVASGTVRLVDSQDTTLNRTASISPDGAYSLTYVPAGTYVLSVPFASSSPNQPGRGPDFNIGGNGGRTRTPASTFQPFQETLTVTDTDLSDVNVNLTPATQTSSQ